jgi:hypothetical protein
MDKLFLLKLVNGQTSNEWLHCKDFFLRWNLLLFFMLYAYILNMSYVGKTYIQENKCRIFTNFHLHVLFTFLFVFLVTCWLWKVGRLYYFAQINQIPTRLQVCKAKEYYILSLPGRLMLLSNNSGSTNWTTSAVQTTS